MEITTIINAKYTRFGGLEITRVMFVGVRR